MAKKPSKQHVLEQANHLFAQADTQFAAHPELAHRYVTLARKMAMKVRLRLPSTLKRKYCQHCYKYLRSGANARIRTRDGKIVIYCLECKKHTRIPLTPRRRTKPKTN